MLDPLYKYPRLYLNASFSQNVEIALNQAQAHYLKNVLRKDVGDDVRVFNGSDGEWLARLTHLTKKNAIIVLNDRIRAQAVHKNPVVMFFSPIKKQRLDFLIEKAVELGVTELRPIITNRTENRRMNVERIQAHIIEAAEQCERLDIPTLQPAQKLIDALAVYSTYPIHAALERCDDAKTISECNVNTGIAFLIGPEGGFDVSERELLLKNSNVFPIHLGETILRAETAVIACLSYAYLKQNT